MQTQSVSATVDPALRVVWNCPHWQHPPRKLAQPSVVFPCCSLYVPVWHAAHTPFASTYPALHTQYGDAESKTPVDAARSLSHSLQPLVSPGAALYSPAAHAAHAAITESAPSVVSYPASHRHAVFAALAAGEDACSGQSVHATEPVLVLYLPSEQPWHVPPSGPWYPGLHTQCTAAEEPTGDCVFAGHCWHALFDAAPRVVENVFVSHATHVLASAAPTATENLPSSHSAHVPAVVAAKTTENVPAPQSVHATEPEPVLYFPAAHAAHVPPLGPVYPRLQTQLVSVDDPAIDCVSAGHARQALSATAPVVVRYLPAPQSVHATEPVVVLYLPAAQAEHVPPLGPVNPRLHSQLVNDVDPTGDRALLGHPWHIATSDAPRAPEYVSAAHATHALSSAAPTDAENFPAPHATHALLLVAPVEVKYLPAPQSLHASEPTAAVYLPAAHTEHWPPSGPEKPTLHLHAVAAALPGGACAFPSQLWHVAAEAAPTTVENEFAPHATHVSAPAAPTVAEYVPAMHATHAPAVVAPEPARYVPAAHAAHAAEPAAALNVPAAHAAHAPPSAPVKPAAHLQSVAASLPCALSAFAGQLAHAALPAPALNVPAGQSTHVAPSAPDAPASHLQSVSSAEPAAECEFAGHASHVGLPTSDHVPAPHVWHVSGPVAPHAAEKSPPPQLEHSYRLSLLS
jgi:hypothetical protein